MQFVASNVERTHPLLQKEFHVLGDGKETDITIDLKASPLGMQFYSDNYPKSAIVAAVSETDPTREVKVSVYSHLMKLEFNPALPDKAVAKVIIQFWYAGVTI